MKHKSNKIKEKFTVKKTAEGYVTVPDDASNHPLLTRLWDGEPIDELLTSPLDVLIGRVKDVGKRMGMTVNVCGHLKTHPVFILYYRPVEEPPPPLMIFEEMQGDGSHCGITDLYEDREVILRKVLKAGLPFDTGWWASKKEIWSARISRDKTRGPLHLEVSAGMDSGTDLVDTAFWEAAGSNANAGSGYEVLSKAGVKGDDAINAVIEEMADALELGEDNYARRDEELRWNCSYDYTMEKLSVLLDSATAELESTYQDVVSTCKWKLEQLKEEK